MNTAAVTVAPACRRHIGKCHACKRVFSVLARYVGHVGEKTFEGYASRRTRGGNSVDAVFETADGSVMAGSHNGRYPVVECDCAIAKFGAGWLVELQQVKGILKPNHVCNAKCTSSKGHVCECSCGGKNHGGSFSV